MKFTKMQAFGNDYVYIDATTGKQVEMFKVINSEQGQLLI